MKHTLWLKQLFSTFISNTNIDIYFEEKDKLKEKKPTINLSIHPIRFADDIFFNFETNDDKIKQRLKKYEVDYKIFYYYADLVKATYLKTVKHDKIKENSLLLVGQTSMDKVIFDGKKYHSITDYIDEIKSISSNYTNIYFKPHPYAKNNKKVIKILKKNFPNIKITLDNIYHLLANDKIKHVVGLNSSVLYEAKYFKKEVTFLYKQYFDFDTNDIGIYADYFDSKFWADILDTDDQNIKLPFVQNRLRKSLNDFWGYNQINDEIVLKDIIKTKIKYLISKIKIG
ncbi:polysialyltransferase family glycosyltransferase [Halarcobacter sp.]|uniref:capsular polysaccharide export protein, LipB/KpsS family n=1 Tax=Halarcobacter sp. TaxID=2321133 RepID=UPI0029F5C184|nr:hypothetical protein [Halarcobacter sp.]